MKRALEFALSAAAFTALVGVIGGAVVGPDDQQAVWLGAALAYLIQMLIFMTLFVWVFARRPMLAHGVGMLARLAAVGSVALLWAPWAVLPAAPFLFSLVAVFFLTTLLEPLFLTRLARGG